MAKSLHSFCIQVKSRKYHKKRERKAASFGRRITMKIRINKKVMEGMLFKVCKGTGVTTKAITECIYLYTSDDALYMEGNNFVTAVRTYEPADIIKHGQILVSGSILSQIIRKMPEGEILLEQKDKELLIKKGKLKFQIAAIPDVEQFTRVSYTDAGSKCSIRAVDFVSAIKGTLYAVSPKAPQIIMTGMHVKWKNRRMQITATDGYKVARRILVTENQGAEEYIIPGQNLLELTKIMVPEDTITMQQFDRKISFHFKNTIFISNLIDGNYYNVEQLLSIQPEFGTRVTKNILLETLERSSLLKSNLEKKPVVLHLSKKSKELSISIETYTGSLLEDIPISSAPDMTFQIGMNERFLIDVVKSIEDDEITMYFMGSKNPLIIKDHSETYIHAILPVNLGN